MTRHGPLIAASGLVSLFVFAGCSGGSAGDRENRGRFEVSLISTGQGQIYPYRIRELVGGQPTTNILNIESDQTLADNVAPNNSVLPVATFPTTAVLPDGSPGNQYVLVRFSNKLEDPDNGVPDAGTLSILSNALADSITNSGLTTAISLIAEDPNTESTIILRGRGFVAGSSFFNRGGELVFAEKAVSVSDDGHLEWSNDAPEAQGFPGAFAPGSDGNVVSSFNGATDLVANNSFVFVADTDNNLQTFETFDPSVQNSLIRIVVTNSVRNTDESVLEQEVCTATTVGTDPNPPNVIGWTGNRTLELTPTIGSTAETDPTSQFVVRFNKPVQPREVGTFFSETNLTPLSGAIRINVTLQANNFDVAYYADPFNFGDYCNYRVTPAYALPGEVDATLNVTAQSVNGLGGMQVGNDQSVSFRTAEGPGVINAPVAPDAIYVGIGGGTPGVSVIDLNGRGQGTSSAEPTESAYALGNPNVGIQGVLPTLQPGTSGLDAGSKGFMTLAEDSRGNTILLGAPTVGQVGDIHLGAPLDLVFNNSNINVNASSSNQVNPQSSFVQPGNCISIAPHPNPPPLRFPPPNLSRLIFGEEPNVTSSQGPPGVIVTANPPCAPVPVNQLVSASVLDYYPHAFEGVFNGPQRPPGSPPPPPPFCPFTARQQIGHFMYVLDQENDQILVVNSNRFTVIDTINLTDPFSMAFSPTLALMAVTNFSSSTVSFIDTDPRSPSFHTVIAETRVAQGPTAIAWQPDGEAILVLSTSTNILTVLNVGDFAIQSESSGSLNGPLELAVTPRYAATGNGSNVFYAYILNSDGTVAVYESGPNGPNGIGFDDIIGTVQQTFRRARMIRYDGSTQLGGFYICHVDDGGLGRVSRVELTSTPFGVLPTNQISGNGLVLPPTFRQKQWSVTRTYGGFEPERPASALLSGDSPIDVVTDEMFNNGFAANQITNFNTGVSNSVFGHSTKGAVVQGQNALGQPLFAQPNVPSFLFIALSDVGRIDVFDINTTAKFTTLSVPGVTVLATYFRQ